MRKRFLMTSAALLLGLSLVGAACTDDEDSAEDTTTTEAAAEETTTSEAEDATSEGETIVDIAAGDEQFSTLVTAVTEAGLVETLSGEGPFTVFAPTNAAFEALPEGTLDTLLEDPEGALTEVLQLHVIDGEVDSTAALEAVDTCVETLGGPVRVAMEGEELTVGGAVVSSTDIEASNGIIHVIDSVIVEPSADC
jgi:uncharacterized surface protein with fasciclin (FAS1) repeats